MRYLKLYEKFNMSPVREVTGEIDIKLLKSIKDERNEIKVGDIVISTYFMGSRHTYEFEVTARDPNETDLDEMGNADDNTYYSLETAYHVIKKSTYDNPIYDIYYKINRSFDKSNIDLFNYLDIIRDDGKSIILDRLNSFFEQIGEPVVTEVVGYKTI